MDSGDLGYRADGELYITGRRKDMIIKAGRNLYPQEVEEMVGDVPGIRKGCVAAFGVGRSRHRDRAPRRHGGESRRPRPRRWSDCRPRSASAWWPRSGIPPDTRGRRRARLRAQDLERKDPPRATRDAYLRGDHLRRRASPRVQWGRLLVGNAGERLRRLAGRGGTSSTRSHVAAVTSVTLPPLWLAVRLLPGAAVDRVVRRWCRAVLALAGCRLELEGRDNLRAPSVLVANHSSYLDVVALLASIPMPIRFVAKRELKDTALIGTIIRKVGHLTVERFDISRSVADAETVARALRREASLLFFPEGTFRAAPGLLPFRLGAFKAAVEAERPVIPIAILGTREILPADRWILPSGTHHRRGGHAHRPRGRGLAGDRALARSGAGGHCHPPR